MEYSLNSGRMSIMQRQGIITLLPEKGRQLNQVQNWRPITLLNVDNKIISKTIATGIKDVIAYVIHPDQKGFILDRFIGENIMDIYALIDKMEEAKLDGLLVSINFYKDFNSIEWNTIHKVLEYFDFPVFVQNWFEV